MKLLRPTLHHMPLCYPPLSQQSVNWASTRATTTTRSASTYAAQASLRTYARVVKEEKVLEQHPQHPPRRWVVERTHGWLNRYRRLLVRWDKKAQNYTAMLHFACGLITFRQTGLLE